MTNTESRRSRRMARSSAEARQQLSMLSGRPSLAAVNVSDQRAASDGDSGADGELWLYGVVGGWWRGFNAEGVADALRSLDVERLTVRIHSPGGDASDGVAIGNLLRNHRAHVTVVVDGLAASAASVIALAGDEVVMCPGSQMMLHDASTYGYGNAATLRELADWIDNQSANYASVYAYKAGGTPEAWRDVMRANNGRGTWYTADAAVSAGLATEVGTRTAAGSPPVDTDEDLDDDAWLLALHDLDLIEECVNPAAAAVWNGTPPKPPTASAGGSTTTHEGSSAVAFTDTQITTMREKLGIAEDADEATILAALDEALEERADTSTIPSGHVVVPEARLADLEANATRGAKAAQTLHERERTALLDANKAKFLPDSRASWETEYDRSPEAVVAHFAKAPDLIPVDLIGHEHDGADASVSDDPKFKNWRI